LSGDATENWYVTTREKRTVVPLVIERRGMEECLHWHLKPSNASGDEPRTGRGVFKKGFLLINEGLENKRLKKAILDEIMALEYGKKSSLKGFR